MYIYIYIYITVAVCDSSLAASTQGLGETPGEQGLF